MDKTITREYVQKLAENLMFTLSDDLADQLVKEFHVLSQRIDLMNQVDTSDTEEMVYPFEQPTTYLREDEVDHVISQEDALKNVDKKIEGHFILPRVVK